MKFLVIVFCLFALSFTGCKKNEPDTETKVSLIKVDKNGTQWSETSAVGTFNTKDNMVSIMGLEGLETFTIRFEKPVLNGKIEFFDAVSLFSPARGAASVSDAYHLDTTKSNTLRIYVTDNIKKRIAGEFYLYLQRDERFGTGNTNIYQGKFDIQFDEVSF